MVKRKSNPIKPASLSNPNPDYVFPIPEANKILGAAYTADGTATVELTKLRSRKTKNKDELLSDQEQLKYAADDFRVGKEYLSGKRNAFNVQRTLSKRDEYMPDLYQPMMDFKYRTPRIDLYDWRHLRDESAEWSGNFIADVIENSKVYYGEDKTLPSHLQMNQFRKYTKEEKDKGLVWDHYEHNVGKKEGWVENADWHKNVEEAYKTGIVPSSKSQQKYEQLKLF